MSNNSFDDQIPSISIDEEDRDSFYRNRQSPQGQKPSQDKGAKEKKSGGSGWAFLALLVALGAGGAAYWLYTLNQQQQAQLVQAQERIGELEKTLSATGEEIGESTVAIQVKVGKLVEKTDQLWEQMDKLWASAWRRNQSDIKEVAKKADNQYQDARKLSQNIQNSLNETATTLELLKEQLDLQQQNSRQLIGQLNSLQQQSQDNKQVAVNAQEQLVNTEQQYRQLARRLVQLEQWRKEAEAKLAQPAVIQPGPAIQPVTP